MQMSHRLWDGAFYAQLIIYVVKMIVFHIFCLNVINGKPDEIQHFPSTIDADRRIIDLWNSSMKRIFFLTFQVLTIIILCLQVNVDRFRFGLSLLSGESMAYNVHTWIICVGVAKAAFEKAFRKKEKKFVWFSRKRLFIWFIPDSRIWIVRLQSGNDWQPRI